MNLLCKCILSLFGMLYGLHGISFEPPRAGRFEQKFQQRDSELTLGSAGSIGESLPESAGAPPTPSSQAAARNITSFIAPGSSGNHAAPAMAAVAVQGTAPLAPSRDSTASSYAEAPNAQILKAQSVIRDHYARNALPQR